MEKLKSYKYNLRIQSHMKLQKKSYLKSVTKKGYKKYQKSDKTVAKNIAKHISAHHTSFFITSLTSLAFFYILPTILFSPSGNVNTSKTSIFRFYPIFGTF